MHIEDREQKEEPLVWIEVPGNGDATSRHSNLRKVRTQAMRHVVATTQRRVKTLPTCYRFVESSPDHPRVTEEEIEKAVAGDRTSKTPVKLRKWLIHAPHQGEQQKWVSLHDLPQTDYASARTKFSFDITSLNVLTCVHMGRAAAFALHNQKSKMANLVRCRGGSFLDYIPSYYPSSSLLRSVVDCTLARAHRIMVTETSQVSEEAVYLLYGKALRKLHRALNDLDRAYMPDVLCSVLVMQLFEVLDFSQPDNWLKHTAGITKLVQMRGPGNWKSALERSLLCSQLGTIFGEVMLRNEDSFLQEDGWQQLLESMIEDDNTKYSPLVTSIWRLEMLLPRMLRLTGELIMSPDHDFVAIESLTRELERLKRSTSEWQEVASNTSYQAKQDKHQLPENLALSYAGEILANRAIIALNPLRGDAVGLEEETMETAQRILQLKAEVQARALRGDLLIMRVTTVANMAHGCHKLFERAVQQDPDCIDEGKGTVTLKVWDSLNVLMARKIRPGLSPQDLPDLISP